MTYLFNFKYMFQKIKSLFRMILEYLPIILILVSFCLSIVANIRVSHNSKAIADIVVSVSEIQKDVSQMSVSLTNKLDSMQAQLDFISKYSEANYLYFYGDVDGRYAKLNIPNNSKTKK